MLFNSFCLFGVAEDDIMHITLQKRDKGQTWASPIQGQGQLDPYSSDLEQKRLMLQRFQEEVRFFFFFWVLFVSFLEHFYHFYLEINCFKLSKSIIYGRFLAQAN